MSHAPDSPDAIEALHRNWRPDADLRAALREWQQPSPGHTLFAITTQWLVIAGAVIAAEAIGHWLAVVVAIVLIAGRQHALGILAHEGVHRRLCRRKRMNDLLSDLCCAFPIGLTSTGYGIEHIQHHREPNTAQDPYWEMFEDDDDVWRWPKSPRAATRVFLLDVLGLNALRNAKMVLRWGILRGLFGRSAASWREIVGFSLFWTVIAIVALLTGTWRELALYWFAPLFGPLMLFVRLRVAAEHLMPGHARAGDANNVNHVDGTWIERAFIAPLNINYHIAHHLFPGVPWHRLPRVHRALMNDPEFRQWARRYTSYLGARGIYRTTLIGRRAMTHARSHAEPAPLVANEAA